MRTYRQEVLLSFILPVYNVEKYLCECVDSILQQVTADCEIVLVDDGSKDSSGKICDRYARQNPLIRVIHKENGGLSSARNAGISAATGKYITFVDSDDRIVSGSLADVMRWIKNEEADLCFLQTVKFFPDGTRTDLRECIEGIHIRNQSRENAIAYLATRPKYPGSAWSKLFRREFLISNHLHFPFDRRYSEDLGFLLDCILCAERFDALDVLFYEYRQSRQGSITNRFTARNFYDLLRFVTESSEKLTVERKPTDAVSKSCMSFVAYEYLVLMHAYQLIPRDEKKMALKKLKANLWTMDFANNRRGKMVLRCCHLLGIRFTSYIMYLYRKLG